MYNQVMQPTFPHPFLERWIRPKEREKEIINILIDRGEVSGSGYGVGSVFEEAFAKMVGCRYVLTFSHGTDALMAAYFAAGVGPGDEVITPAVGYIASYAGALHLGARPIFADIDGETLLIDPKEIRKKITERTRAINIAHLNGRICPLDEIREICEESKIPLIEDAAHAHGAEWDGKKIGNADSISCFSLQGVNPGGKPVGGGEGGVACTNNRAFYQCMLLYSQLHRKHLVEDLQDSPYADFDAEVLGLKWRAEPISMGLSLISLSSLDERNGKRAENYQKTIAALQEFPFIKPPRSTAKAKMGGFFGNHRFIYDPTLLRNTPLTTLVTHLRSEGVPIQGHTLGSLEYRRRLFQKGFDLWGRGRGPLQGSWEGLPPFIPYDPKEFPQAEKMKERVFTLPSFIDVDPNYFSYLKDAFYKVSLL